MSRLTILVKYMICGMSDSSIHVLSSKQNETFHASIDGVQKTVVSSGPSAPLMPPTMNFIGCSVTIYQWSSAPPPPRLVVVPKVMHPELANLDTDYFLLTCRYTMLVVIHVMMFEALLIMIYSGLTPGYCTLHTWLLHPHTYLLHPLT